MSKLNKYIERAGASILSATTACDCAMAAEKMMSFSCVGEENLAWKSGPYLSSPANKPQINRTFPYLIMISHECSVAASLVIGNNPVKDARGGVNMPQPKKNKNNSGVEGIIAKMAIIEQFELYKEFAMTFSGPFNKKNSASWKDRIHPLVLEKLGGLADRRNELTHDSECVIPTIREAVDYYLSTRSMAISVYEAIDYLEAKKSLEILTSSPYVK